MKQIVLKGQKYNKFFILIFVLFISNFYCFSQSLKSINKTSVGIPLNISESNIDEQSTCLEKFEKISQKMNLKDNEKKIIIEIKKSFSEALIGLKEAEVVHGEIAAETQKMKNSSEDQSDKLKDYKKIVRKENSEITYKYDAEELFQIGNSLLFNIYESHVPSISDIEKIEINKGQQINNLVKQAKESFAKAIKIKDNDDIDLEYKEELEYLKRATFYQREAIIKFEQVYYLYYDFQNENNSETNTQLSDNNVQNNTLNDNKEELAPKNIIEKVNDIKSTDMIKNNSLDTNTIKFAEVDKNIAEDTLTQSSSEEINSFNNIENKIVFKVQVGAYRRAVNVKEFNGLYPLFEDKKDQEGFSKYMVGEYYSFKAANEARRIISKTTSYKDAFVVAYKNQKRIVLNNEIKSK